MLEAQGIYKSFQNPDTDVLFDVSFRVETGDFLSITGRSGSGKSTLLYIISSLDTPTRGEILIDGQKMSGMTAHDIHRFRNESMGFVFQFHYLLPELTALENVLMPARKTGSHKKFESHARQLLSEVGLESKSSRFPKELSGGEQQRVAIARALVMSPRFIFADEPTGNLDSQSGEMVMSLLEQITHNHQTAVIYVTHDLDFAARARHRIHLADGRIVT